MKVLLLGRMAAGFADALAARAGGGIDLVAIPDTTRLNENQADLETAEMLVGWPLTREIARRAPRVRLLQASGVGIDGLDLDSLPEGVMVANTIHHEGAIGEWVMLMMLELARRSARHDRLLRQGDWAGSCIWGETPVVREIRGSTALMLGIGNIARETARRARAFGVRMVGVSRGKLTDQDFDEVIGWDTWRVRVPESDYVIPSCPLTPETEGLIGAAELASMRPDAFLINMTRGRVVDEHALYEALRDGRIGGAAIDVWYQYPAAEGEHCLPSKLPFHELDNVILSPHISGWTEHTVAGRVADIAENIRRLAAGEPLLRRVR